MELVVVKVRPLNGDRKMHVLRFLVKTEFFSVDLIKMKLNDLFPYGYFNPVIERYMIDYVFLEDNQELFSCCNHDYLAKYLTSNKKLE